MDFEGMNFSSKEDLVKKSDKQTEKGGEYGFTGLDFGNLGSFTKKKTKTPTKRKTGGGEKQTAEGMAYRPTRIRRSRRIKDKPMIKFEYSDEYTQIFKSVLQDTELAQYFNNIEIFYAKFDNHLHFIVYYNVVEYIQTGKVERGIDIWRFSILPDTKFSDIIREVIPNNVDVIINRIKTAYANAEKTKPPVAKIKDIIGIALSKSIGFTRDDLINEIYDIIDTNVKNYSRILQNTLDELKGSNLSSGLVALENLPSTDEVVNKISSEIESVVMQVTRLKCDASEILDAICDYNKNLK